MNLEPTTLPLNISHRHKKLKDPILLQVINYLRLNHDLCEAYLLSKSTTTAQTHCHFPPGSTSLHRTFSYTLLIITKSTHPSYNLNQKKVFANPNAVGVTQTHPPNAKISLGGNPSEITDVLYNHTQKQARVCIIPFTLKTVRKELNMGCNFLSKTISNTPCVYKQVTTKDQYYVSSTMSYGLVKEDIHREWGVRLKRAAYLYEKISSLGTTEEPVACFEILQSILEQTCLGMLYVFMEYKPSYTGLNYLLHLCNLFTDLPEKVFPANSYQAWHILHHLQNARHNMRYKTRHRLTLHDADRAYKKCGIFLHEAETLVEQYFKKMETGDV